MIGDIVFHKEDMEHYSVMVYKVTFDLKVQLIYSAVISSVEKHIAKDRINKKEM